MARPPIRSGPRDGTAEGLPRAPAPASSVERPRPSRYLARVTGFDAEAFVASCLEASRTGDAVSALRLQVERAIADPAALANRFPVPVDPDDDGILHRSADLLITCAIFPRGFATGIHDHSVPAVIGLWAG